jgi:hypothetical protein
MRKTLDRFALAIRLLGDLKGWAEGESFIRRRLAHIRTHRDAKPVVANTSDLDKFTKFLTKALKRLADDTLCHDNCKNLYFCTKKKNHKGKHRDEFGLTWEK